MHKKQMNRLLAAVLSIMMILSLVVIPAGAARPMGGADVAETPAAEAAAPVSGTRRTASLSEDKAGNVGDSWVFSNFTADMATAGAFDGLALTNFASHNGSYARATGAGAKVEIPVAGQCNVEVSCQFGCGGTVGVGSDVKALKGAGSDVETVAYSYEGPGAGTVTVSYTSGSLYLTKIEIKDYNKAPEVTVDKEEVVTQMGTTAAVAATLENATASGWDVVVVGDAVTAMVTDGSVTITPAAVGKATVTVKATTAEGGEYTKDIVAYVAPADIRELQDGDKLTFNSADGKVDLYTSAFATVVARKWHSAQYGLDFTTGNTVTMKVPADKKANIKLIGSNADGGTFTATNGADASAIDVVKNADYTYEITGATGTVVITATAQQYLAGVEVALVDLNTASLVVSPASVTMRVGESKEVTATATGFDSSMKLFAISGDETKATTAVAGDKVTITGMSEGTATVYVCMAAEKPADAEAAANVAGMKTVSVTVNAALPEGTKEWNFKADGGYEAAKTELDFSESGISPHSYGMMIKSTKKVAEDGTETITTASLGIPVDGPSKITVYVGYTWNISLGDAQSPARYGTVMQDAANTPDAYKAAEFIYTGDAGKVTLTAGIAEPTTYIEWIKVEPLTLDVNKVEVWDFGAEALNTAVFDNKLTVATIAGWFPEGTTTANNFLPSPIESGDFYYRSLNATGTDATGHRLRTTTAGIPCHDNGIGRGKLQAGAVDPYDTTRTQYTGILASNGAANAMTLTLKNTKAGDKLSYAVNENGNNALDFTFTDAANVSKTVTRAAGEAVVVSFYATADGDASITGSTANKPVFARIYRETPATTTVSGSFTADGIPAGYKLVFTNDDSGIAYEATVSGSSYTVDVPRYRSGTSYTASITDAEGWIVAAGDTLEVAYTNTAVTNNVTAVSVDLAAISGTITGIDAADTDTLGRLVFVVTKPDGKIYQPKIVLDGANFSAKFEKGETYTLAALNANDYTLDTTSVSYSANATDATIAFTAKPVQTVTIVPTGLELADLAAAKFTFTNINETYKNAKGDDVPYTYTFTGTDNIKLRAGQYKVKVDGITAVQKLTPDLKVADAAVNCPIAFNAEVPTAWDFRVANAEALPDAMKGLTASAGATNYHGAQYGISFKNGTITIPVPGPCTVVVSVGYNWDVHIPEAADHNSAETAYKDKTNSGDCDVTFSYTGAEGTVNLTAGNEFTSYVKAIKVLTTVPFKDTVTVGAAGKDSTTIQGALDMVAKMERPNNERVTIMIDPGDYEEQIQVRTPNVTLKNAAATPSIALKNKGVDIDDNAVRITWYYGHGYDYYSMTTGGLYDPDVLAVNQANGYASFENKGGNQGNTTYWNSTVTIHADGFEAEGIIFENSFNQYMSAAAKADTIVSQGAKPAKDRSGLSVGDTSVQGKSWVERAAAVGMGNNVGNAYFENCALVGHQDILFGGRGTKMAFYDCELYGACDYIMGPMNALFAKCDFLMNTGAEVDGNDVAYITAGQQDAGARGYLMWNCTVGSTTPGVNTAATLPSKPGTFGRAWSKDCEVVWYETIVGTTTTNADGTQGTNEVSLIQSAGWTNGLGGKFDRCAEYNTHEKAGTVVDRLAPAKVLEYRKLLDGTKIDYETWLGDWTPFDDKGKDMTVTCPGGHPERTESVTVTGPEGAASTELVPGETATEIQLTATAVPSTATVTWTSSSEVVTVAADGKVTVPADAAPEEVTITATASGKDEYGDDVTAEYTVTVKSKTPAEKVTITGPDGATSSEVAGNTAATIQLTAAVTPAETTQKVKWTSDSEIVIVDETGLVTVPDTANGVVATITATALVKDKDGKDVKATYVVTVKNEVPASEGKIVILHSNDVHGAIESYDRMAQLKADYEAAGATVYVVDAGDFSQGTVYVSASQGATAVELMNLVGYDLATTGNHEFDYGAANLDTLATKANFDILAGNIMKDGQSAYTASVMLEAGDKKIGVFGLETPETATKAHPAKIQGLTFLGEEEMFAFAQSEVDALKADGANYIICLGHLGIDPESTGNRSIDLLTNVNGIDVFIDGHSHSDLDAIVAATSADRTVNGAQLTSTGTKFANIGVVTIDADGTITTTCVPAASVAVDATNAKVKAVTDKAAAIMAQVDADFGAKFATSTVDLNGDRAPGNRTEETNLGDLITDAMLWLATKDDLGVPAENVIALTNGGGIRAAIAKGDVTKKDVNTVLPFGNTVAVAYVKGSDLLEALEASTYCTPTAVGGFPQVAGITFTVDTTKAFDAGEKYPGTTYDKPASINRVTINSVNGKAFDPDAEYAVVTNDFVAAGGDTYYALAASPKITDTGVPLDEALMDYITTVLKGTIGSDYAKPQGRITVITADNIDAKLDEVIKAAEAEIGSVKISADGKDVNRKDQWVTQTAWDAYNEVIKAAKDVAASTEATAADKIEMINTLNEATAAFKALEQAGTKKGSAGGGSPAYGTGTNPDGTEKPATETKTNANGDVATIATASNGDVTITVVNKDGETVAEISLPASIPAPAVKFKDVPDDHWAAKSINDMAGLGMVKGVNEAGDHFDMNSSMTRGAVATMFFRLANGKTGLESNFADVQGHWAANAVAWAAKTGVVNGYSAEAFGPDDAITRQQLAVMLCRFANLIGMDTSAHVSALDAFTDADQADAWATDSLAWCVKNGVMKGRGNDTLDPLTNITRTEATVMFDRMIGLMK